MVLIKSLIGAAAVLSGFASALPQPGYSSSSSSECGSSGCGSSGSTDSGSMSSGSMSGCSSGDCGSMSSESMSGSSDCSSGDCGMSMADSSSTMMMESSMVESSMMMESSTMMAEPMSTMMAESTSTAAMSYSTPSYGSGGSSWGSSGYDGCVQQCIASFGSPGSYQPTVTSGSSGSSGSGSTITVVVAPTKGVFRYYPFAVNASVGDTIKFMWGADNHTVTKSSELTPCNKTGDAPFASGTQNQSFVFTQVVNDTNTTFFYCGTPTHCQKGMFGIINPPNTQDVSTSVAGMMPQIVANDTSGDLATYASYTSNQTSGSMAANWGASIDMAKIPDWAQSLVAENVMFTRNALSMNPDNMNPDGSVNLASINTTPMMVPPDITSALNAASSSSGSSSAASAPSSSAPAASGSSSPSGATSTNGAMSVSSSKMLVGAMALIATVLAL